MTGDLLGEGTLLGGRVRHRQLRHGHRTGIEPVFLAATIPARPGERVLEAGTGSGAALLCLAARVPGLTGIGIERDPAVASIARENIAINGFDGLTIVTGEVEAFRTPLPFDHAFANPPWHRIDGTASPDRGRDDARRGDETLLARWARALAKGLRERGTLTFVLAAGVLPDCFAALAAAGCGSLRIVPLWPHAGEPAKLVIVQARRGGRGACEIAAGLVLHEAGGAFTGEADAILRGGSAF